jgi:hypothetical protein
MTDEIKRAEVLPCPLAELSGGCDFTVTLPEPDPEYRPTWLESVRRSMYASEHAETWSAEFREHLRTVHTADELLEYVTWEPHRIWTELD